MKRALILVVIGLLAACGDDEQPAQGVSGQCGAPSAAAAAGTTAAPVASPQDAPDGGAAEVQVLNYSDDDFVEADSNRDPFRSYALMFKVRPVDRPQRAVKMPTTGIDEMRLSAIITGTSRPRAMLVDGTGVGHVVQRADYIGRPDVVQTGGVEGMPVTLNWRVDRIRANEVVLTREDPTAPGRPPLTRVIPLYEQSERPPGTITEVEEDELRRRRQRPRTQMAPTR